MSVAMQDLRLCVRQLGRRPLFTCTAVLTLSIGMGVNTVAFTVVNGVLFRGSAVAAKAGVGRILTTPGGDESGNASLAEYERFAESTRGALDLAAEGRATVAWRRDGATHAAWVLFVSPSYFTMVDVQPINGRLAVGRTAGVPSIVISERFWREQLDAADLAGLTLVLNEVTVGVAGVLPESFTGPAGLYSPELWLPLGDVNFFNGAPSLQAREHRWLFLLGRILAGTSAAEVQSRVEAAAAAMARDWPDTHRGRGARFRMMGGGNGELRQLSTAAAIAMGVIGLVLLLACFNVANLLLARAVERERDLAVRAALGAGAARLMRLAVTEGMVIATLGGVTALALAGLTQPLVGSFAIPVDSPQHIDLTPDLRVVMFTALLVLVAGLPGLWPAAAALRVDVVRAVGTSGGNSAGARSSRVRGMLVAAQVAGSTAFLIVAALLAQSFGQLSAADRGFDRDRLLVAEFSPSSHGFDDESAERYSRALAERIRALPGVSHVALADRAPFFVGFPHMTKVSSTPAGCGADGHCVEYRTLAVDPAYFDTIGTDVVAGRAFTSNDTAAVIVNRALAMRHWPDGQAVGKPLRLGEAGAPVTVVGIIDDTDAGALGGQIPALYVPLAEGHFNAAIAVIARATVDPATLVRGVRLSAQAVDARVALLSVKTMEERGAIQLWPFRTLAWLFSICGVLALALATAGLGGVVIHIANQRRKEYGLRIAVGASPRHLVGEVLAGGAWLTLPGVVIGSIVAAGAARLMRFAFYGIDVLDSRTYVAVAAVQCGIVLLACLGPAIRTSRIDPVAALRSE